MWNLQVQLETQYNMLLSQFDAHFAQAWVLCDGSQRKPSLIPISNQAISTLRNHALAIAAFLEDCAAKTSNAQWANFAEYWKNRANGLPARDSRFQYVDGPHPYLRIPGDHVIAQDTVRATIVASCVPGGGPTTYDPGTQFWHIQVNGESFLLFRSDPFAILLEPTNGAKVQSSYSLPYR